jgi:hypothetical protein
MINKTTALIASCHYGKFLPSENPKGTCCAAATMIGYVTARWERQSTAVRDRRYKHCVAYVCMFICRNHHWQAVDTQKSKVEIAPPRRDEMINPTRAVSEI